MTTKEDLRFRILRLLSDPTGQQYSVDLIDDAILAAHEAILPWLSNHSVEILEGDGDVTEFELPEDVYRIMSVLDQGSNLYIPEAPMAAGYSPGDNKTDNEWSIFPQGSITFSKAPESAVRVVYGGSWPVLEDDSDNVSVPAFAHRGLAFYAASYILLSPASVASNIRQWNVNIDSGTPVMNPMRDMAVHYLERFRIEMERIPTSAKGARS